MTKRFSVLSLVLLVAAFVGFAQTPQAPAALIGTATSGSGPQPPDLDTAPDQFTFTDQTGVSLSSTITSAAVTIAGIDSPAAISVSGGSYDVNASGSFTTSPGTVSVGNTVRARHTSSGSNSTATNTVVTIGGVADTFTSTTVGSDTTPSQFTFTDQSGVALSSTITSAAITVSGIDAAATITVTGGTYDKNSSGSFTASAGTVVNGDTVRARHTSSGSNLTATNTAVTIGGVSDTFTSTTLSSGGDGLLSNGDDRCDELGSACIGAMTFQATAYSHTGDLGSSPAGMFAENPTVATSKIMRAGYSDPYTDNATFYTDGSSGFSVVSNCYSGAPSPVRCLRSGAHVINTDAGSLGAWNTWTGRLGSRFYVRLNVGFDSTGGACTNDKYQQFGDYISGFESGFTTSVAGTSFSPSNLTPASVEGVWVRVEAYMDNWQQPTNYSVYFKRLDTGVTYSLVEDARIPDDLAFRESLFPFHLYRDGTCGGDRDIMFAVFANWPAGGSTRIYGAPEVEGEDYLDP
jgi:hypothetical protein